MTKTRILVVYNRDKPNRLVLCEVDSMRVARLRIKAFELQGWDNLTVEFEK